MKATKKKTPSKKTPSQKTKKPSWPPSRNVLFRPGRLKYVRRMITQEGCVFCAAAQAPLSLESLCVFKSKHAMIMLNKYPYNSGHLLVLPLAHQKSLLGLSPDEFTDLHQLLRLALEATESVFSPAGVNIGLNHGAVAGAGIPDHIHYHLVPRWAGDLNFFPLIAETKVVVETLEQTYTRFIEYFKKRGVPGE